MILVVWKCLITLTIHLSHTFVAKQNFQGISDWKDNFSILHIKISARWFTGLKFDMQQADADFDPIHIAILFKKLWSCRHSLYRKLGFRSLRDPSPYSKVFTVVYLQLHSNCYFPAVGRWSQRKRCKRIREVDSEQWKSCSRIWTCSPKENWSKIFLPGKSHLKSYSNAFPLHSSFLLVLNFVQSPRSPHLLHLDVHVFYFFSISRWLYIKSVTIFVVRRQTIFRDVMLVILHFICFTSRRDFILRYGGVYCIFNLYADADADFSTLVNDPWDWIKILDIGHKLGSMNGLGEQEVCLEPLSGFLCNV